MEKLSEQDIVDKVLQELSLIYSKEVFEENFASMKTPYKVEDGIIFILVENEFIKNKLFNIYSNQINEISKKYSHNKIIFKFISHKEIKKTNSVVTQKMPPDSCYYGKLEPKYNFDNFVVGSSNIFAFKIAKKIADDEEVLVNPLYIFGDVGLGKTHLMHSIGNYILKKNPQKKILYIKADGFIEDFTNQLKENKMEDFNNKYRNIDLLLIDDIQIMADAKRTQIEFFKLFDYLNLNKKQIVITSDKPISQLNNIMERLTNRFKAGLVGDIKKPNFQHCLEILKKKLFVIQGKNNIKLTKEILSFISAHFNDNIREMEGALLRLVNYIQVYGLEINLKNTIAALEPLLKNKNNISKEEINVGQIQNIISEFYNIKIRSLISKQRHRKYTLPRDVSIYFIKKTNNISNEMIGFLFNKRHASTISKSYRRIEKKMKDNEELKKTIEIILKKINDSKLILR
ncbi:chromosomal replication initiator protein DnaA [Candidatus Phytoplasma melaleucae]|uniref:Chromosomal replication initiator protein DnaA n=1 Tax=Candidatus Phytoplasma melaleucae TaxID=2982630 RepID=A0ABT9DFA3_9MOLU|nr:chromosomal replication initiator protein DnaA ['Melaleuca sp.' phytoplasma]MDO8168009.1 chromosomal replication initiator protein DnaA ['Melaleuca sp.' phytoplasma]MDV3205446.1 chromosomal replication initiator protein DnaA [Weeping tea tree witches'-broom phytoplasma]